MPIVGWIFGLFSEIINSGQVKIHLSCISWIEGCGFEFDYDIAMQPDMIKEPIDPVILSFHLNPILPSHEGKAISQLDKKFLETRH